MFFNYISLTQTLIFFSVAIFDDVTTLGLTAIYGLVAIFGLLAIFHGVTKLGLTTIGDFLIAILGVLIIFLVA